MEEEKLVKQLIGLHLHKDVTGMRTFSVRLPQHVYDALRFQCTAEDKQLGEVIEEAVRQYLENKIK